MGNRRMFSKKVIETDKFFDMSSKTQLIYFYLNLEADDDGFIGNIKKQMRVMGGTSKQLDELVDNGYIIMFDTGVAVIAHWRVHNLIRKDRYTETVYKNELELLYADEQNVYRLATKCQPKGDKSGDNSAPQDKLSKDKLSKANKRESTERKEPPCTPRGEMNNILLTEEEYECLKAKYSDAHNLIDKLSLYIASTGKKYSSHYATLLRWIEDEKTKQPPPKNESCNNSSYDIDEFFEAALRHSNDKMLKKRSHNT